MITFKWSSYSALIVNTFWKLYQCLDNSNIMNKYSLKISEFYDYFLLNYRKKNQIRFYLKPVLRQFKRFCQLSPPLKSTCNFNKLTSSSNHLLNNKCYQNQTWILMMMDSFLVETMLKQTGKTYNV